MAPSLGSGPIESAYHEKMNLLAGTLDEFFNPTAKKREDRTTGFILMVFPFDQEGKREGEHRCNYISNANREDVITLLKEQLAYFQGQSDTHQGTA